jgi:nucleotide-binding universal stress UspA family protein
VSTEEAQRRLRCVLPGEGATMEALIAEGSAPEQIAAVAEEQDAAIICAGVARYNSIGDFLLGNAVDALCRHAQRPVLVVKERPRAPYQTIIFPTDFSGCSRQALLRALVLLPEARIRLVHAYHVPYAAWNRDDYVKDDLDRDAAAKMDEFIATFAAEPQVAGRLEGAVVRGNLFEMIYEVAEKTGANLVAFGTHGESGIRHATIGSMANELLNKLTLDSLIIRVED